MWSWIDLLVGALLGVSLYGFLQRREDESRRAHGEPLASIGQRVGIATTIVAVVGTVGYWFMGEGASSVLGVSDVKLQQTLADIVEHPTWLKDIAEDVLTGAPPF